MAKAKISIRRKKFLKATPKLRLKKGAKVSKYDPFKELSDEKIVALAFWECLKDQDTQGALEIIEAHLSVTNISQLSEEARIPRSTIYNAMKSGNPKLKTVAKLIHYTV